MIDKQKVKEQGFSVIDEKELKGQKDSFFELLRAKFPQVISDNQINLKQLAILCGLGEFDIDKRQYELNFTGKGLANALYNTVCDKSLKVEENFVPNLDTNFITPPPIKPLMILLREMLS